MSNIEIARDDKVAWMTLNRPDKLNAFNGAMLEEFEAAFDELEADRSVSCIVVRGAGRAFSVGYDVSKDGNYTDEDDSIYADWVRLRKKLATWLRVWECSKPVVGAVHGYCMGAGTALAVMTDVTIVADNTVIGWPTMPLGGGMLGPISTWLIGPKRAKELSFIAGSTMTAADAVAWGWANRAVPAVDLEAEVSRVAAQIAKTPLELLAIKKRAINRVLDTQGFSSAVMFGAEFDAISHSPSSVKELSARVREMGVKEAVAWFKGSTPQ